MGTETFPKRLGQLIRASGKTQKEIAKEVGISTSALSAYVRGLKEPGLLAIVALADYFKVSVDFLVGRSNAQVLDESVQAVAKVTGLSGESIEALKACTDKNVKEVVDLLLQDFAENGGNHHPSIVKGYKKRHSILRMISLFMKNSSTYELRAQRFYIADDGTISMKYSEKGDSIIIDNKIIANSILMDIRDALISLSDAYYVNVNNCVEEFYGQHSGEEE